MRPLGGLDGPAPPCPTRLGAPELVALPPCATSHGACRAVLTWWCGMCARWESCDERCGVAAHAAPEEVARER